MAYPVKFTQTTLTKEEVVDAWARHTPLTIEGWTGYVCEFDPVAPHNGGCSWFYMTETIEDMSDLDAYEYGPYYWVLTR